MKKTEKQRFKTIRLFLRLILFSQIYSLHCLKDEVTENNLTESFVKDKVGEETALNYQISSKDTELNVGERPERPARLQPLRMIL